MPSPRAELTACPTLRQIDVLRPGEYYVCSGLVFVAVTGLEATHLSEEDGLFVRGVGNFLNPWTNDMDQVIFRSEEWADAGVGWQYRAYKINGSPEVIIGVVPSKLRAEHQGYPWYIEPRLTYDDWVLRLLSPDPFKRLRGKPHRWVSTGEGWGLMRR